MANYKIVYNVDTRGLEKDTRVTEKIRFWRDEDNRHHDIKSTVKALEEAQRIAEERTLATINNTGAFNKTWEVVKVDELL